MALFTSKKQLQFRLVQRASLIGRFKSKKSRLKQKLLFSTQELRRKSRFWCAFTNFRRIYQSVCSVFTSLVHLLVVVDEKIRRLLAFIESIIQIIRVVYGWIQLIRALFSALHLITSRIMILSHRIHRIFYLLSILLEPFSNRSLEKAVRSFSRFIFYYYSSNGACYTLQARTRHIVSRVRARWKKQLNCKNEEYDDDDNQSDIFYDALSTDFFWS